MDPLQAVFYTLHHLIDKYLKECVNENPCKRKIGKEIIEIMEGYMNIDETVFISMEGVSEKVDGIRCTKKFLCSECDIMTARFFEEESYIPYLRGYHSTNYPNFLSYGNKSSPIWMATIFLAGAYFQKSYLRKFLSLQFNLIVPPEILTN